MTKAIPKKNSKITTDNRGGFYFIFRLRHNNYDAIIRYHNY
jgi:hypothetical protein